MICDVTMTLGLLYRKDVHPHLYLKHVRVRLYPLNLSWIRQQDSRRNVTFIKGSLWLPTANHVICVECLTLTRDHATHDTITLRMLLTDHGFLSETSQSLATLLDKTLAFAANLREAQTSKEEERTKKIIQIQEAEGKAIDNLAREVQREVEKLKDAQEKQERHIREAAVQARDEMADRVQRQRTELHDHLHFVEEALPTLTGITETLLQAVTPASLCSMLEAHRQGQQLLQDDDLASRILSDVELEAAEVPTDKLESLSNLQVRVKEFSPEKTVCERGNLVRAVCDHNKTDENELQFRTGDVLLILDNSALGWCFAQKSTRTSEEGFIPTDYPYKEDRGISNKEAAEFDGYTTLPCEEKAAAPDGGDISEQPLRAEASDNAGGTEQSSKGASNAPDEISPPDIQHLDTVDIAGATKQSSKRASNVAAGISPQDIDWYFQVDRREAEKLLKTRGKCRGTFIVRNDEEDSSRFKLSIRNWDKAILKRPIKHRKIVGEAGLGYFIFEHRVFPSLPLLIQHYRGQADGLCFKLVEACSGPQHKHSVYQDAVRRMMHPEISLSSLTFQHTIGMGRFGHVVTGVWTKAGDAVDVAIKTLRKDSMSESAFLDKAVLMQTLQHCRVLPAYGVSSQALCSVTEFMTHGNLRDYLRGDKGEYLENEDLIDIIAQVASGMMYLEGEDLVFGQLQASTVLVGNRNSIKIDVFGVARADNHSKVAPCIGGDIKWVAPETMGYDCFTTKCDVWSFGVLVYEVMTKGKTPYSGMKKGAVKESVSRGYRMPRPRKCPPAVYDQMLRCWDKVPGNRPTFESLFFYFDDFTVASEDPYYTMAAVAAK